jgi:hypothetical protein
MKEERLLIDDEVYLVEDYSLGSSEGEMSDHFIAIKVEGRSYLQQKFFIKVPKPGFNFPLENEAAVYQFLQDRYVGEDDYKHLNLLTSHGLHFDMARYIGDQPAKMYLPCLVIGYKYDLYTLDKMIADKPLQVGEALWVLQKTMEQLSLLESSAHIMHGDIETDNIAIVDDQLYLIDFGISRKTDQKREEYFIDSPNVPFTAHCRREVGALSAKYGKYATGGRYEGLCSAKLPTNFNKFAETTDIYLTMHMLKDNLNEDVMKAVQNVLGIDYVNYLLKPSLLMEKDTDKPHQTATKLAELLENVDTYPPRRELAGDRISFDFHSDLKKKGAADIGELTEKVQLFEQKLTFTDSGKIKQSVCREKYDVVKGMRVLLEKETDEEEVLKVQTDARLKLHQEFEQINKHYQQKKKLINDAEQSEKNKLLIDFMSNQSDMIKYRDLLKELVGGN